MILVTGASGFLGRHICRELLKRSLDIRLVLRNECDTYADYQVDIIKSKNIFAEDQEWWLSALKDVDMVMHLAWYVEPGLCLGSELNLDCLNGTLNFARACLRSQISRFVGIGTCFEYDLDCGYLSVDTALKPISLYGASKASAYLSLSALFANSNIFFSWCRPFYLYGEGEDARRLYPYIHQKLSSSQIAELSEGSQVRDYMDVRDAALKIVDIGLSKHQGPINICTGIGITVKDFAEAIADQYGLRHLLKFGSRQPSAVDPPFVVGLL